MHSPDWPRILAEDLTAPPEPLALLLRPYLEASAAAVARRAALALVGPVDSPLTLPCWLAPHQTPAARRVSNIIHRYGGALLADAVGLGKSYVALAVALASNEPFALVVPAVLLDQWQRLLARYEATAPLFTHEALSVNAVSSSAGPPIKLFIVDEAHRFRNPATNRYRTLARLVIGARVLLVTATPVHNRLADLFHLFRLFLRDDALTALGVPSLARAARGEATSGLLPAAVARLTVARSRERVRSGYVGGAVSLAFPQRAPGRVIRVGALPDRDLRTLVAAIGELGSGGDAASLFRLLLLTRLSSSIPAFRASLNRYEAYLEVAATAAEDGRALTPREFQRLFPDRENDALQLALFPILLAQGPGVIRPDDLAAVRRLRDSLADARDPKAAALEAVLAAGGKTIVFSGARTTVRYLARRFARRGVAAVVGDGGLLGKTPATRAEVLRAFAPVAQGAAPPSAALRTDLLIATDLLSEGLNLQDAARVIHYDLPWTPARLAQRVGRIDRLGSPHNEIETITFLPPEALAQALGLEERLVAKARLQSTAATAHLETVHGAAPAAGLDWCDRLDQLARGVDVAPAPAGAFAAVSGPDPIVILVVRLGAMVDAVVVDERGARADPVQATHYLELARPGQSRPADDDLLERALERAGPLLRSRLGAIADARWRGADRDRLSRRLIPWVLAAARAASRRGNGVALARLDALISRLSSGMTAGEEVLLDEILERATPLAIPAVLAWHERLPPVDPAGEAPHAELVAALVVQPPSSNSSSRSSSC